MAVECPKRFVMTKLALVGLVAARGAVVNVASVAGKIGEEGLAIYCAAKAALIGLTQALALELGDRIRLNAICPRPDQHRMMAAINSKPDARKRLEARDSGCALRRAGRGRGGDRLAVVACGKLC